MGFKFNAIEGIFDTDSKRSETWLDARYLKLDGSNANSDVDIGAYDLAATDGDFSGDLTVGGETILNDNVTINDETTGYSIPLHIVNSGDPENGATRLTIENSQASFFLQSYGSLAPNNLASSASIYAASGSSMLIGSNTGMKTFLFSNNNYEIPEITIDAGAVDINGDLTVGGTTDFGGDLTVGGTTDFGGDVKITAVQPGITLFYTDTSSYARVLFRNNAHTIGAFQVIGDDFVTAARRGNYEFYLSQYGNDMTFFTNDLERLTIAKAGGVTVANDLTVGGESLFSDKIKFTQTDGKEYIDSLADGYLDLGATTHIRCNAFTDVSGLEIKGTATDTAGYAPLNVHQSSENYWTAVFYNDTYNSAVPHFGYYGYNDGRFSMGTEVATDLGFYTTSYEHERMIIKADGTIWVGNKIYFTQTDGNEAIDSLADGYMDYLATTEHRFNTSVDVTGDIVSTTGKIGANQVNKPTLTLLVDGNINPRATMLKVTGEGGIWDALTAERCSNVGVPWSSFNRSLGSETSKLIVTNGKSCGRFGFRAWDGGTYATGAWFGATTNGDVVDGSGEAAMNLYFATSNGTTGDTVNMTLDKDGNLSVDNGGFSVFGESLFLDKLKFTQTDGNEYIDSNDDNYIDVGATTGIRQHIGGTEQIALTDGKLAPTTDNDIDCGDATHRLKEVFIYDGIDTVDQDLTIDCGTNKTLLLAEVVYRDINIAGYLLTRPTSSQPDIVTFVDENGADTTIETYGFAIDELVHGGFELQHDYKQGTDLVFHIHWQGITAPTGGETVDNVQWRLNYIVMRDNATLDAAVTIDSPDTIFDTQYETVRTDFAVITGTNFLIGDQFMFTLTRVDATGDDYAGDALIATAGIHYQIDTIGSRQITTK